MFERLMSTRMTRTTLRSTYFSQYRKGHSTQHATLDIVNAIQANMNQGLYYCGVFIDLKKAVDTVDHNILLDKLNFNFRGLISQ